MEVSGKNADVVTEKVKKMSGMWRASCFMALIDRAHAVNCKILSKIWFSTSSIPLRQDDIRHINAAIRSWILQDQISHRLSNLIMYRGIEDGGLGLLHVQSRSEAHLIRTFLEMAGNPNFRRSDLNVALLRQRVLGEAGQSAIPGPYYNASFFKMLASLKEKCGMEDICSLSLKQIYTLRLEENVLMDCNGIKISLPVELSLNWLDWETTWRRVRAKGVASEHVSTLLMALHDWLPSYQRIRSMRGIKDPALQQCRVCNAARESTYHILAECSSKYAAQELLQWIKKLDQNAIMFEVFYLNTNIRQGSNEETAVTILTALAVYSFWNNKDRGGTSVVCLRAEAHVVINSLMNSKFSAQAMFIQQIIC